MENIGYVEILGAEERASRIMANLNKVGGRHIITFIASKGKPKGVVLELENFLKLILDGKERELLIKDLFAVSREEHPMLFDALREIQVARDRAEQLNKEKK